MKTFIKWSGNKLRYIKYIFPHVPRSLSTYIEPFVGSGSMFLYLKPSKWIINDLNRDLTDVWLTIQNDLPYVQKHLKLFKAAFEQLNTESRKLY